MSFNIIPPILVYLALCWYIGSYFFNDKHYTTKEKFFLVLFVGPVIFPFIFLLLLCYYIILFFTMSIMKLCLCFSKF